MVCFHQAGVIERCSRRYKSRVLASGGTPCLILTTTPMTLAILQIRLRGKKGRKEALEKLLKRFLISLEVIFTILIKLGLQTPETLHKRIPNGDLYLFIALARAFKPPHHMRRLKDYLLHPGRLYQDNTVQTLRSATSIMFTT